MPSEVLTTYLQNTSWENRHVRESMSFSCDSYSVSPEWIRSAFCGSVKLNSETATVETTDGFFEPVEVDSGDFLVDSLEEVIIPSGYGEYAHEQIVSILLNSQIRRGSLELITPYAQDLEKQIYDKTIRAYPVEIILPTLPFKDQNPLTTSHSVGQIDLGEYLLFAQMRDIVRSVEDVYPPGARITLLTDGLVYADLFAGGNTEAVEQYRNRCMQIRDEMGIADQVDVVDMAWVVEMFPYFSQMREHIESSLQLLEENDDQVAQSMAALQKGMLLNTPLEGYSFDEALDMLRLPMHELPEDLSEELRVLSLRYASFLLAMKAFRVLERAFPGALRATVHPKSAPQLPVHLVNRQSVTFPYNGVPVVSESKLESSGSLRKSTRIMRYYKAIQNKDVKAVYVSGNDEPFYYMAD